MARSRSEKRKRADAKPPSPDKLSPPPETENANPAAAAAPPLPAGEEVTHHRLRFWRAVSWCLDIAPTLLIWSAFFGLLWLLRHFFALIFITFVFAFVSASGARFLGKRFPDLSWRARVTCVFAGFLLLWTIFAWLFVPQIQAGSVRLKQMIENLPSRWNDELEPKLLAEHEWYSGLLRYLDTREDEEAPLIPPPEENPEGEIAGDDPETTPVDSAPEDEEPPPRLLELPVIKEGIAHINTWVIEHTPGLIGGTVMVVTGLASMLFLATLFSFLIILDLDGLLSEVRKLDSTKLGAFYRETGSNIVKFGEVLGRVLEAQAVIALTNTVLTAIGLWIFGVPQVAFLSLIVFLCGFIPVAGVFLSSVPICVIGLYQGGPQLCVILILFIVGIHFVEAYLLNPYIMGAALKVNPVLTLIILVIGHHAFGVWGMLLGLPVCYYFFTQVIRSEKRDIGLWVRYEKKSRAASIEASR